tara:strand:- start:59939 stop:62764 length:2826 start_codon:yes stop_codon:yes gene_type:complete
VKSFYKILLPAAAVILNFFTPALATTVYRQKLPSELSENEYTYALEVQTGVGTMDVEIHAKENAELYVKRVAQILKEDAPKIIEYFGYVPWNTVHFVVDGFVSDRVSNRANGAATVHPRPLVLLFTAPPVGMEHLVTGGDWVKNLVLHELIHILHLDQTAGFIKFLRYLWGSDGKLGGIVPNWFAEGVATWGEAEFTNGGRLSRSLFRFEYKNRVLTEGTCSSTVCLDNTKHYPGRGSRYWYGSHFLKWLEDKKPGSMACLIKNNSDNIPGFLHWAFRDCVQEDYQVLFDRYFEQTKSKLFNQLAEFRKSNSVKGLGHIPLKKKEYLLFSDGVTLKNDKLFISMLDDKKINQLKVIDLKLKTQENTRVDDIIEAVLPATTESGIVLKTFREYSSRNGSFWKLYDPLKKKLTKEFSWSKPKYLFQLKDRLIGLIYEKTVWEVWENKNGVEEKLFDLPPMTNVFNPEVIERDGKSFISYRFHDYSQSPSHEYLRVDLDTGKEEVLFQSENSLEVVGSCGTRKILRSDNKTYSLNIRNGYVSNLPESFNDFAYITGSNQYTVLLFEQDPKRIYFNKKSCQEWIDDNSGIEIKRGPDSIAGANKNYIEDKSSYPEWDHFLPQRWGIGATYGGSTDGVTLSSSVNDPAGVHSIGGTVKKYFDIDEVGSAVAYSHSNDYFDFGTSYSKGYIASNIKQTPDSIESSSAYLSDDFVNGWLKFVPTLSYSQGSTSDFVSSRKYRKYSGNLYFSTTNVHRDDFLNGASFQVGAFRNNTVGRLNYLGYRSKLKLDLRLNYFFDLKLKGTFEKLDKNDLGSGVAYGGGHFGSFHDFYGLQTNDAFGNEVQTGSLETNILLNEAYSGPRYIPLYIKEIKAVFGSGFIKSDFVFIESDGRFLRDKTLLNVYGGLGASYTLFYGLSGRVDYLLSKVISEDINNNPIQQLIVFKAGF